MAESKAMILGCGGLTLTDEERSFFRAERPWGFILFARNIHERQQVIDLVASMRECVGRTDAPVLIDQEGGRVQRIKPPLVPDYPPASAIGDVYRSSEADGLRAAWLMGRLHAHDLSGFGINVDCLPVLDVPMDGGHDVIGNRAFCKEPEAVAALGRQAMDGLTAGGVLPVIKHMPGHGRATVDSHLHMPVVDAEPEDLETSDFVPFKKLADAPMAMTAHVMFSKIDPDRPSTSSPVIIEDVIRKKIGFNGLLMSDDLSMKALSGDFASKTDAIFGAGCDVVLHCNGVMEEMVEVSAHSPDLDGASARRAQHVLSLFGAGEKADEEALRAEFAGIMGKKSPLV
ncbi:beta-N-acetylhexosaminidase [Hoeflea prorocentri]|uniref:beta-N-acetylhexosaminidase n=1 Tax=Hoeflea prorocentri TaxID=1922333 RepID=A0A9X3ZHA5_9HYPH|nr:beta-N-acetylhexosaminidase [Hoeflea prorocentri]MCY6380580.1 beta-N-acetylhexosaminidase [Hoeflea prorocentri]MDA5398380.1 beta-N-acetylhexosaminidase [Hoeflea prorocentri]